MYHSAEVIKNNNTEMELLCLLCYMPTTIQLLQSLKTNYKMSSMN